MSFRDDFGQWDPKEQRPELWNLFNGRINAGESIRVFPLSNWTELDVWRYVARENIELPDLYYAHQREVFERDGMLLAVGPVSRPRLGHARRSRGRCGKGPRAPTGFPAAGAAAAPARRPRRSPRVRA